MKSFLNGNTRVKVGQMYKDLCLLTLERNPFLWLKKEWAQHRLEGRTYLRKNSLRNMEEIMNTTAKKPKHQYRLNLNL